MLGADFMPRSHNTALQKREGRFHGVCVNVADNVDPVLVPNRPVPLHADSPHGVGVSDVLVRDNHVHILADVLTDVLGERRRLGIGSMKESEFAGALADADDNFFVLPAPAPSLTLNLAADVGLVHLNRSGEFARCSLEHRSADAMAEVPSRFVADSERPLNLAGRHALLGLAKQKRSEKPLLKGQVRIVEDRTDSRAELVLA